MDLPGVALLSTATLSLLVAVSQGEHWGWTALRTVGLTASGVLLLLGWTTWTPPGRVVVAGILWSTCGWPCAGVLGPNVVAFGIGLGMYGLLTLVILLVQSDGADGFGLGRDVAVAGWVLMPYAVLSESGNRLARAVATRRGPDLPLPARGRHLRVVAAAAGAGPMAFQLLRYLGFSVGSATSVALVACSAEAAPVQGRDPRMASVCLLVGWGCQSAGGHSAAIPYNDDYG